MKKIHMHQVKSNLKSAIEEIRHIRSHESESFTLRFKNILAVYRYYLFLITKKAPLPRLIFIDPINICQLKCPLCPGGTETMNYERKAMSIETFRTIVDKIPFIKGIGLLNWGEPFLNQDIFKMIRFATERHIKVWTHSNFNFLKNDDFFIDIVQSGLDWLAISLDGASQESYSKYRAGGDFGLVITNIKKLVEAKSKLKREKPDIIWKFVVNRFNEHEIDKAKIMANDLKIKFSIMQMGLADDLPDFNPESTIDERKKYWLPKEKKYIRRCYSGEYKYPLFPNICSQLFYQLVVAPDGKVFPCCWLADKENVFGDLLSDSFEHIWNNEKYLNSRLAFLRKDFSPDVQTVCFTCKNFRKSHSFKDKIALFRAIYDLQAKWPA
jgi:radical SAM protein with 4Fe4S-binding SPASM domain